MNYTQALDYLYSQLPMFQRIGQAAYKADLNNTIALCKALGNPEKKFRAIHIAGTNGKGSTSHYLASILQYAGYKTGLFTSPHYIDFRERIKVNGKMIGKGTVTQFVQQNKASFERIQPSFFEMSAGLAFKHFANKKVDVAVIETGMGGRLDSTNVIHPDLCVITNIGFDHTQFLGDTLEKIAGEKAGIIKKGIPAVIGESHEETDMVFVNTAKEKNAPIYFADKLLKVEHSEKESGKYPVLRVQISKGKKSTGLSSGLVGDYQLKNLLTVLQAVEILREMGYKIPDRALKLGIRNVVSKTKMLGRWQILNHEPLTICDSAHNEHGLKYVIEQLRNTPHKKLHIVLGVVSDKDIEGVLSIMPKEADYYFCKPTVPRALPAEELQNKAQKYSLKGNHYPTVNDAVVAVNKSAQKGDLIFIGGSTFTVADALATKL